MYGVTNMNEHLLARIKVKEYRQFGRSVLLMKMPFRLLQSIFTIDGKVQRELDLRRKNAIRDFILETVKEGTFYFSPFIFSARGALARIREGEWELVPGVKMAILDGQHRVKALESALQKLKFEKEAYEDSGYMQKAEEIQKWIDTLESYEIAMQIYLDLSEDDERQLFTDINTERKEAHGGLVVKYDRRDRYAEWTRTLAQRLDSKFEIERNLSRLTTTNSSLTSMVIMKKCLIALIEGNVGYKEGEPVCKYCREEEVPDIAELFFTAWMHLFPKQAENRKKYVSGLSGVQIALAYTVYRLVAEEEKSYTEAIEHLKRLKEVTSWRHDDPLFAPFYDKKKKQVVRLSEQGKMKKLSELFLQEMKRKAVIG
ncbi:DNA sulfur modification protein DndB [Anoxybacillus vitaminiphilus]|uniref:DNA sulfur modification protein DndB n=2 Tax=Paranoxybacillus vitaminiphilus TaxID=581036 RepID=A0A327YFM6_9BACL|nr:DNA sulfur modification protein DndB [Anoxybacillus vitaminiphilus]